MTTYNHPPVIQKNTNSCSCSLFTIFPSPIPSPFPSNPFSNPVSPSSLPPPSLSVPIQAELAQLYIKAGLKNVGTVFLLTDAQVPDEKFLVLINDLLASGEIPDLFAEDELEGVINGVRNEVKGVGLQDTKENCWSFFIDRVRRQLKVKVFLGCIYLILLSCVYNSR